MTWGGEDKNQIFPWPLLIRNKQKQNTTTKIRWWITRSFMFPPRSDWVTHDVLSFLRFASFSVNHRFHLTFSPRTLVFFYSTVIKEEYLKGPRNLSVTNPDGDLQITDRSKILHYRRLCTDPRSHWLHVYCISCDTEHFKLDRLYHDFILLLFLHTHRETPGLVWDITTLSFLRSHRQLPLRTPFPRIYVGTPFKKKRYFFAN